MKTKPLIETNPYLKNPKIRGELIARSVRTSCGVEGIKLAPKVKFEISDRKIKRIYQG